MIGIGGIGMSALAQLFVHQGKVVSGSDRSISEKVEAVLKSCGIDVLKEHSANAIATNVDLVVYSDAVVVGSEGYVEREAAVARGIPTQSYFEALGKVAKDYRVVAVSGTHGKTTTTGMLGKILVDAGAAPTVVVGSIVADFGTNFVPGTSDIFVVEADEYREHFLNFTPEVLIINNIEHDHTDFYPTLSAMQSAFHALTLQVPEYGVIVTDPKHPNIAPVIAGVRARIVDYTKTSVPDLLLIGEFNRNNARAAKEAVRAIAPTVQSTVVDGALQSFKGSWRRFEFKGTMHTGALVYDDYAHHPTAVAETLRGIRERFPQKRVVVAFHPHLYSRTRDLLNEFARAFVDADFVLLAPIFAAREVDDGSVSSELLAVRISETGTPASAYGSLEAVAHALSAYGDADTIIVTMGAGNIYTVAEALVNGHSEVAA
jgi:UDP-N-acetylmuramate--alanine ligase